MPTTTEIAAAANQFVAASNKAHAIVNGPASGTGSVVETTSGEVKTHARQQADFEEERTTALAEVAATLAALNAESLVAFLGILGVPTYANLTAANTALAIGSIFYNQATSTLAIATA